MSKRSQYAAFWAAIAAVVVIGVVVSLVGRGGSPTAANADTARASVVHTVTVGISDCGGGWGSKAGGVQSFELENTSTGGVEVFLQGTADKKVYLDLESVGAGAHLAARVTLTGGRYRFVCFPADADPVVGPSVTVGTAPPGSVLTPGVVPISQAELVPVAKAYGRWVDSRLPSLTTQVAALADDAEEGDLARAKTDWLAAHLTYETLGAAYGAFGDLDSAINGTPASGRTALDDPDLTGFHKIEALLWSGAPAAKVAAAAAVLKKDVAALAAEPDTDRIDPLDIGLRSHEIVENAVQFELTGDTDAGSHSNLATVDANLTGAEHSLAVLAPLLASRYPKLAATDASLTAAQKLVRSYRSASGAWTPLQKLSRPQREQLNAAVDGTVELLAPVAEITEPRKALP